MSAPAIIRPAPVVFRVAGQARRPVTQADSHDAVTATGRLVDPQFRLTAAVAAAALCILGQLALAVGLPYVGEAATSAFVQFGPGVAFSLAIRPAQRGDFVLLSLIVGPAILTLVAMSAVLTGAFSLETAWLVLGAITLLAMAESGSRDLLDLRATRAARQETARQEATLANPTQVRAIPHGVSLLGLGLALLAAAMQRGNPQPGGVALTAGPLWFVGAGACLVAVILAWHWRTALAVPILSLTTLVVGSQTLMYGKPTVSVSSRHVGIVDYLLVNGQLDLSTDIYQAWSGLFSSGALTVRVARIEEPFTFAAWWAVAAAPVLVLVVRFLAGRFLDDRRAWLAALIFALASSLNTVFFAPQVFGFVLAVTVVGLLVDRPSGQRDLPLWVRVITAALLCVALAPSHQISPYMITCALLALVVMRLVRPWWSWLLPLVPAVVWALLHRDLLDSYVSSSTFGQLFANLAPPDNAVGALPVSLVNRVTFLVPAATLLVVGLVALVALVRVRSRLALGLAAAAASSVVIMLGTEYGNEGIFRVALFALPWLAILACLPVDRPGAPRLPKRWASIIFAPALAGLFAVSVLGQSGMDWSRVVRSGDVAAVQHLERQAPVGSVVLALGTDLTLPYFSTARYEALGWISRDDLVTEPDLGYPTTSGPAYDAAADLKDLTSRFAKTSATRHYAVIADSMGAHDERYGNQLFADHEKLGQAIAASKRWRPVSHADGIWIYELRGK